MKITIRQIHDVTIADISGRIVLGEECAALREAVQDLMDKGNRKIIFNLAMVDYIDSSGLGNLIGVFARVRKQGGELKLLKLTNKIHDLLQITKLYTIFEIMDDEAEAVNSFDKAAAASS